MRNNVFDAARRAYCSTRATSAIYRSGRGGQRSAYRALTLIRLSRGPSGAAVRVRSLQLESLELRFLPPLESLESAAAGPPASTLRKTRKQCTPLYSLFIIKQQINKSRQKMRSGDGLRPLCCHPSPKNFNERGKWFDFKLRGKCLPAAVAHRRPARGKGERGDDTIAHRSDSETKQSGLAPRGPSSPNRTNHFFRRQLFPLGSKRKRGAAMARWAPATQSRRNRIANCAAIEPQSQSYRHCTRPPCRGTLPSQCTQ